jgi:hypothetical protein
MTLPRQVVPGRDYMSKPFIDGCSVSTRWSRETKLGEGARYITRNFDKLTA